MGQTCWARYAGPSKDGPGKGAPLPRLAQPVSSQLIVTVTGAVCAIDPAVPVTITVTCCDAGAVWLLELLPPPQATTNNDTKSSKPSKDIQRVPLPLSTFRFRVLRKVPNNPTPGNSSAIAGML